MKDRDAIKKYMEANGCSFFGCEGRLYFIYQIKARYWRIEDEEGKFLFNMKAFSKDIVHDLLGRLDFYDKGTLNKKSNNK